jgi:hypothetical protein
MSNFNELISALEKQIDGNTPSTLAGIKADVITIPTEVASFWVALANLRTQERIALALERIADNTDRPDSML